MTKTKTLGFSVTIMDQIDVLTTKVISINIYTKGPRLNINDDKKGNLFPFILGPLPPL